MLNVYIKMFIEISVNPFEVLLDLYKRSRRLFFVISYIFAGGVDLSISPSYHLLLFIFLFIKHFNPININKDVWYRDKKQSSFLITDYYSIKANKTKRKNCQRDSSVLASDSYVFFFPSHIEKLPVEKKYISKVILHFVFCLFAWFLNFDLDLFCMILHLLCFLYVCLLVDF